MTRIYIALTVYNYDRSPRHQRIEHVCQDVEQAKHLLHRLETLNTVNGVPVYGHTGRTGGWLERNHNIYGFIDSIEGIFEETTRRIA